MSILHWSVCLKPSCALSFTAKTITTGMVKNMDWTIFGSFLDHFIGGMYTISTQGGVGCSLSVLREGWEAGCYYPGRGERRTITTQEGVGGGCNSKHFWFKGNWGRNFPLFLSEYSPLRLKNPEWANKRYIVQNQIFYKRFLTLNRRPLWKRSDSGQVIWYVTRVCAR